MVRGVGRPRRRLDPGGRGTGAAAGRRRPIGPDPRPATLARRPMGHDDPDRTQAGLGFGLALVVLAANALVSYTGTCRPGRERHWVAHTREVLDRIDGLVLGDEDAEAAGAATCIRRPGVRPDFEAMAVNGRGRPVDLACGHDGGQPPAAAEAEGVGARGRTRSSRGLPAGRSTAAEGSRGWHRDTARLRRGAAPRRHGRRPDSSAAALEGEEARLLDLRTARSRTDPTGGPSRRSRWRTSCR